MGLYSEVLNSFEGFGPRMTGVLQTKDLECVLDCYWLAPDGKLFKVGDMPCFSLGQEAIPSQQRQRVRPYKYTGGLVLYGVRDGIFREVTCLLEEGQVLSWWDTNVLSFMPCGAWA